MNGKTWHRRCEPINTFKGTVFTYGSINTYYHITSSVWLIKPEVPHSLWLTSLYINHSKQTSVCACACVRASEFYLPVYSCLHNETHSSKHILLKKVVIMFYLTYLNQQSLEHFHNVAEGFDVIWRQPIATVYTLCHSQFFVMVYIHNFFINKVVAFWVKMTRLPKRA